MAQTKGVVLRYIDVLRIHGGDIRSGDSAGDVVIGETVVGEIIFFESRAAKVDADGSGVLEVIVLCGATFAVAEENRRSNSAVVHPLPTLDVETYDGDVS